MSLTIRPEVSRSFLQRHSTRGPLAVAQTGDAAGADPALKSQVKSELKDLFAKKASDPEGFHAMLEAVFGAGYDKEAAEVIRRAALAGDFSWLPPIVFTDKATLHGNHGAYDAKSGIVYIDRDEAMRDPSLAASTYVEEAGHHLDTLLNTADSEGDEGELFRRMLEGEALSADDIAAIRAEDDHGTIEIDGRRVDVEFWFGDDVAGAIGDGAKDVGGAIADGANAVGGAIADGAKAVGDVVGDAADAAGKAIEVTIADASKAFGNGAKAVGGAVNTALAPIAVAAGKITNGVEKGIGDLGDAIHGAAQIVAKGTGEWLGGFADNLLHGHFGEAFESAIRGVDRVLFQAPQRLGSGILDAAQDVGNGVTDALGPLGKPLRAVSDRIFDIAHLGLDTLVGIGSDLFRLPFDAFAGFVGNMEHAVRLAADGEFGEAGERFGKAFLDLGSSVLGHGVDVGARVLQAIGSAGQTSVGVEPPAKRFSDLSPAEQAYLKNAYGDSIDYSQLRIKMGGPLNDAMNPHTVGNTVYLPVTFAGKSQFDSNGKLTAAGLETLGHEVGHVWQNQNGGGDYIHHALTCQCYACIADGKMVAAYNWAAGLSDGLVFEELNAEQQARLMEHVAVALADDGAITATDGMRMTTLADAAGNTGARVLTAAEVAYLQKAWEAMKAGQGGA